MNPTISFWKSAMAFSQHIKDLIFNAHQDNCVCLLATIGEDGPNVSPKSSLIVLDDGHLAFWERAKRASLDNLRENPKVSVISRCRSARKYRTPRRYPKVLRDCRNP